MVGGRNQCSCRQHGIRCGYACGHYKGVSCENQLIPDFSDEYNNNESYNLYISLLIVLQIFIAIISHVCFNLFSYIS